MSTDEHNVGSPLKPSTSKPVLAQNTSARGASNLLRHQHSFEARYSSIIQNQIWETTINKDVMERQLNEYFPFARSASLTRNESDSFYQLLNPTPESSNGAIKARSLGTTPIKNRSAASLDKFDTSEKPITNNTAEP
ncbi:uncharacterized protein [Drosophila virilis]|uniref:Uncharacterized protein n=1 Tax=Drosophila virilis TaxID=7244 RepID=B4MCM6_DROVI|nr:uncharacterized protein LOC6635330 [Drosophila virilis]EDW71414.1 uncharacterized protein Dvir_GJ19761 [Drosophila virilis]